MLALLSTLVSAAPDLPRKKNRLRFSACCAAAKLPSWQPCASPQNGASSSKRRRPDGVSSVCSPMIFRRGPRSIVLPVGETISPPSTAIDRPMERHCPSSSVSVPPCCPSGRGRWETLDRDRDQTM